MQPKITTLKHSPRTTPLNASPASIRDEAALLLSIADIAESELKTDGIATLWDLPTFPLLAHEPTAFNKTLSPRNVSLKEFISNTIRRAPTIQRARAVSMDYRDEVLEETLEEGSDQEFIPVSPSNNKRKLRCKSNSRKRQAARACETPSPIPSEEITESKLQPDFPKGALVKRIFRKKFSWKNYPELEAFLVANREEYLKHSALNYTVQQKNYNNRLTERLLDLASENGYLFDAKDFNFVTVRDRIRCYYKSYVQSAKKRGVLMGYAARKAGLLSEEELIHDAEHSTIISP